MRKKELNISFLFLFFLILFTIILRTKINKDFFLFYVFYFHLSHLFILLFLFISFYGTGEIFLRRFKFLSFLEELTISVSLGAGFWSIFILLLGISGVINKGVYLSFLIPLFIYGLFLLIGRRKDFSFYSPLFFLIPFLYLAFLGIFTPPLSYDALAYHMAVPKFYLMHGKIINLPHHLYSDFPFNMEMLYLLSLRLFDDYIAKGLHLLMGVLLGIGVYLWASREGGRKSGLWASLFYFSMPLLLQLSTLCYNDLALSLFIFLSFYSLFNFKSIGGVILSGIFSGLAMGTKYTGIIYIVPFLFFYILFLYKKERIKLSFLYLLVSFLVFSPWIFKNIYFTGNPIYPLFYPILGGKNFSLPLYQRFLSAHTPQFFSFPNFFHSIYSLLKDSRFGFHFLFLVPLLFFPKAKKYIPISIYCFYFLITWYLFTHRDTRFAFSLFPFLSVLFGIILFKVKFRNYTFFFLQFVVIFSLTMNWVKDMAYFSYYDFPKVSLQLETRDKYLEEKLYFYPALEFINKNLPENSKILFIADNQTYYCNLPYLSFSPLDENPFADLVRGSSGKEEIMRKLKKWGITHLYLNLSEFKRVETTYHSFSWGKDEWKKFEDFLNLCEKLYDKKGVSVYALP